MKTITHHTLVILCIIFAILFCSACRPLHNMQNPPQAWGGFSNFNSKLPANDTAKKNVFIIADYKMTELFDMLAPFYLFCETGKANVYIIAKDRTPVLLKRDLFVIPQITFSEVDSLQLRADVIVIPALSKRTELQDTSTITWIRDHFTATTKIIAICDGASTAAATGLYDGKLITCHASDYEGIKAHFSKPKWIQNVSVTKDGNLFSTAGVSNAVEGSLTVINELFGREKMLKVLTDIHYPHSDVRTVHKSIALTSDSKAIIAKKLMFKKNRDIGLLIDSGINEFNMASILDTYSRTLPASFNVCNLNDSIVRTKHGLTLISSIETNLDKLNELHVITPASVSTLEALGYKVPTLIEYDSLHSQYPIETCLKRIAELYGTKFQNVVKVSLDYN